MAEKKQPKNQSYLQFGITPTPKGAKVVVKKKYFHQFVSCWLYLLKTGSWIRIRRRLGRATDGKIPTSHLHFKNWLGALYERRSCSSSRIKRRMEPWTSKFFSFFYNIWISRIEHDFVCIDNVDKWLAIGWRSLVSSSSSFRIGLLLEPFKSPL